MASRFYRIYHEDCGGLLQKSAKAHGIGRFQCKKCLELVNIGNPDTIPHTGRVARAKRLDELDRDYEV